MKRAQHAAAKAAGEKRYWTGRLCKRGHVDWRLTSNGNCMECARQKALEFYYVNPTAALSRSVPRSIRWQKENPQRHAVFVANWQQRNKGTKNASTRRRRAAKLKAVPPWADLDVIRNVYAVAANAGLHVDHIVPLRSPLVCGLHCEANLQALSQVENCSKANRYWPDMP